jgi:hypothetical protein
VQVAFVVALVGAWYLATNYVAISSILLPNPVAVYYELTDVIAKGEFIDDLRVTLTELLVAFSISSTLGVTLGYLISRSQYSIRVFEPLFAGMYSVPMILFLPLFILGFGLGPPSKIAIGTTVSFFPIILNTIAGFGYVDRIFILSARSMGRPISSSSAACCCRRRFRSSSRGCGSGSLSHSCRSSAAKRSRRSPASATASCSSRKAWIWRACSPTSPSSSPLRCSSTR